LIEVNFGLMQHHGYTLFDIEGMIPWERMIYVNLLIEYLEKEKEKK
jgi:hypothetical protein